MSKAKCDWGGCGREGKWQIGLRMWSIAAPRSLRTERNALKMLVSVCICDECKPRVKVEDFLLPEGKERIAGALAKTGRAAPDFSSAEIAFEEIVGAPVDPVAVARQAKLMGKPVWEA